MADIRVNKPVQAVRKPIAMTGLIYTSTKGERLSIKMGEEAIDLDDRDRNRLIEVGAIEEKLVEV